ncbi:uncharacterized protein PHACADRAFT_193945 [Phanerochaete carnosa HHB-10118-sp]|uniref:Uncharacterized protein n=1 Tax=Phanerochaete carnosa (strain HHB-10118-sp) TaxID=650164 RepID=K5X0Q8_PHACS|nr:uncharacterized protein PHACADRAFT_193945 [Phanerochaete carnosa HHB-10118-sp]EKM56327.1 hypothetical protein PHACADRAFT_193945 [Phanerochaete carnosa HHB-10118-sp]
MPPNGFSALHQPICAFSPHHHRRMTQSNEELWQELLSSADSDLSLGYVDLATDAYRMTGQYVEISILFLLQSPGGSTGLNNFLVERYGVFIDCTTTLDQEIASAVWETKLTVTQALLLSTRWLMLLGTVLKAAPSTGARCELASAQGYRDNDLTVLPAGP